MNSEIDVYVSYANADGQVVVPFVTDLRSRLNMHAGRERTVWIDRSNVTAGANWQDEIRKALDGARVMLAVLSPSYFNSEWAQRDYETFKLSGRTIVPVVLQEFHPGEDEVRRLVGDLVWYAAPKLGLRKRDEEYSVFIDKLAREISDILERAEATALGPPQGLASQPSTPPAKGYVFLSYAEEDGDFLTELRAFFGQRGYAYWEFESGNRDYQKRIDSELEAVISSAVATVSVLSEAWKASTWSMREFFFSQEIGKPVFLLKAKSLSPTLAIAGFPFIDFTTDRSQAFSRLAKELTRAGL